MSILKALKWALIAVLCLGIWISSAAIGHMIGRSMQPAVKFDATPMKLEMYAQAYSGGIRG